MSILNPTKSYSSPTLNAASREVIGVVAQHSVHAFVANSSIYNAENEKQVKKVTRADLEVGKLLGKGYFNHVCEVRLINCTENCVETCESCNPWQIENDVPTEEYAVKYLSPRVMADIDLFRRGAVDLALEAQFLASLRHDNIVTLHAVTAGSVAEAFSSGVERGYFLVIDRLSTTLDRQIEVWAKEATAAEACALSKKAADNFAISLPSRLMAAVSIAQALQYLHQSNVMFRDLKPENIGFDSHQCLKIFDFGLAKEISDDHRSHTRMTGSLRYMAPEVALGDDYGKCCDVYSFGILLWQLYTLKTPFDKLDHDAFYEKVVYGALRPKLDKLISPDMQSLMKECWSYDPQSRPTSDVSVSILQHELLNCIDSRRVLKTFKKTPPICNKIAPTHICNHYHDRAPLFEEDNASDHLTKLNSMSQSGFLSSVLKQMCADDDSSVETDITQASSFKEAFKWVDEFFTIRVTPW